MEKLYILLLLLTNAFTLFAQEQLRSIKGTVVDENNKPAELLSVALEGLVIGTNTNEQGYFELHGIKPGIYTIRVSGVGYSAIKQTVDLNNADAEVNFNISASRSSLDEVIVSAGRTVEALDETPASVHVVDRQAIQNQMQVSPNIANVLAYTVPGLALSSNTTSNVGQTLRGRNVLVMIDGVPQSTPLRAGSRDIRTIDPEVIERIEVVKGATAIYGNGADGGLINYITKKADVNKPFSAYTSLANTGMLVNSGRTFGGRFTQQFSGKLKSFDYLVSGTYEKTGVYKDAEGKIISPVYGLGETKIYNGFLKAGYNLAANQRVELMYNYFGSQQASDYIEQVGIYGETPTIGVPGERQGAPEGTRYNHNAQLRYIGNRIFKGTTSVEATTYMQNFSTVYGYTSYFLNGGQSTILSNKKGARLSLNTSLINRKNINGYIVYGADYLNDVTSQPLVDGRIWVPEINMNNLAPYAQLQMNFFKDLILKAGYRYDNVSVAVESFEQLRITEDDPVKYVNGGEIKFNASTYNVGLRYAGVEAFKPFVSFSQGFSLIDVGRYVRSATEDDLAKMDIEPVVVNNYEAGFHSKLGIVSLSGAYFISTSKLGANLVQNTNNTNFYIQRAPERIHGFEAVADVFIDKMFQVGASAAYNEGKVDMDDNGSFEDAEDRFLNGTRIPPLKVTSYLNIKPIEKLSLNVQWLYSGSRDRFEPLAKPNKAGPYRSGEGPISAFNIFNLTGTYRVTNNVNVNLGIENLLNRTYYLPIAQLYGRHGDYLRANGARYQLGVSVKW
jgi:iron complex outermembrane receptor protein